MSSAEWWVAGGEAENARNDMLAPRNTHHSTLVTTMRFSAKTEYACIAILELAAQYGSGEPARVRDIADAHGIPSRFLVQILLQLKAAGLVSSTRGAAGGYQLIRPPADVSLADVMSVIEDFSEPPDWQSENGSPITRALRGAWREVAEVQRESLVGITLADLLDRAEGASQPMYYI